MSAETRTLEIGPEVYAILHDWCYEKIYRALRKQTSTSSHVMTIQSRGESSSSPGDLDSHSSRAASIDMATELVEAPVGALATFPFREPPSCRRCGMACHRRISNIGSPNDGRPFYECPMCPSSKSFATFDDFIGINKRFPICHCQPALASRRLYTGLKGRTPGREFYMCPIGRCEFFHWAERSTAPIVHVVAPQPPVGPVAASRDGDGGGGEVKAENGEPDEEHGRRRKRPKMDGE